MWPDLPGLSSLYLLYCKNWRWWRPRSSLGRYSDLTILIILRNITVFWYCWNSTILIQKRADPSRSETPWVKASQIMYEIFVMIMTNIDHHSTSILRKFDSIDYCDFHYNGIMIICPTLHGSRQGTSHFVPRAQVIPCYQWLPQAKGGTTQQRNHKILPGCDFMSCLSRSLVSRTLDYNHSPQVSSCQPQVHGVKPGSLDQLTYKQCSYPPTNSPQAFPQDWGLMLTPTLTLP